MEKDGKYIYCIVNTKQERNFGNIGIGGNGAEVLTIGYNDISMIVNNHPLGKITISRENMLTHEKVIEKVMEEFDSVLPVRFGTIASNADEIRNLLDRRYREFRDALAYMDHKVELGVKGIWNDMTAVFEEITKANKNIESTRDKLKTEKEKSYKKNIQAKIEVGKMVEKALLQKKEEETDTIVQILKKIAVDYKLNKTIDDKMFMNASFLVSKGRGIEFDNVMNELSHKYKNRTKFMYAGPLPPYNFVNLAIYPESWEV